MGWSWTWITFWRCCGNTCPSFAFIPRKEEVHGYIFKDYYLHLSLAHKCISSNLFQLKYFLFLSERPDFNDPIIMRRGSNVEHVVSKTSKNLLKWHKLIVCFFLTNLLGTVYSLCFQCHRIHRTLASQFKYSLVWVSKRWRKAQLESD